MRIYLIGFMGSGKTKLGSHVASILGVPFLDTDQMIEEKSGKTITSVFEEDGEDAFRSMEAGILRDTTVFEKALIATGGGLPMYHNNMEWLMEHGITMYLEWPEDDLLESLIQQKNMRPLISSLSKEDAIRKARQMLKERIPIYELASVTIGMTGDGETDAGTLAKACKYIW